MDEIARLLIKDGHIVNIGNSSNVTPLHLACYRGHASMVQTLLEHSANARSVDKKGHTPFGIARALENTEILKLLEKEAPYIGNGKAVIPVPSSRRTRMNGAVPIFKKNISQLRSNTKSPKGEKPTQLGQAVEEFYAGLGKDIQELVSISEEQSTSELLLERPRIDQKYFGVKRHVSPLDASKAPPKEVKLNLSLKAPECLPNQKPLYKEDISCESVELEYLSANQTIDWTARERWTFVLAGRKEAALVPSPTDSARVVLVMPYPEKDGALQLLGPKRDILLVKSVDGVSTEKGYPTERRIAISEFAKKKEIQSMMVIDDNIEGFAFSNSITDWSMLHNHLHKVGKEAGLTSLSMQSYSPPFNVNQPTGSALPMTREQKFGAKAFLINCKELFNKGIPPRRWWPRDVKRWGGDVYFQYLVRAANLKNAALDRDHGWLIRSRTLQNTCVGKLEPPEKWVGAVGQLPADAPEYEIEATRQMEAHYNHSKQYYEAKTESLRQADLTKFFHKEPTTHTSPLREDGSEIRKDSSSAKQPQQKQHSLGPQKALACAETPPSKKHICGIAGGILQKMSQSKEWRVGQLQAIKALGDHIKKTNTGVVTMATGSGKTRIFTTLADELVKSMNTKENVLIVAPRKQIVDEIAKEFRQLPIDDKRQVIIVDSSRDHVSQSVLTHNERFQEGGRNTVIMCNISAAAYFRQDPSSVSLFGAIFIDESHTLTTELGKYFSDYAEQSKALFLGFSATPQKGGKKENFFGEEVFHYSTQQAVQDGCCTPWTTDQIEAYAEDQALNIDKVIEYLKSKKSSEGKSLAELPGIVWAGTVQLANTTTNKMREHGFSALPCHSRLELSECNKALSEFESSRNKTIVTAQMLQEGYNGRPFWGFFLDHSKNKLTEDLFTQVLGRTIRTDKERFPEKEAWFGVACSNPKRTREIEEILNKTKPKKKISPPSPIAKKSEARLKLTLPNKSDQARSTASSLQATSNQNIGLKIRLTIKKELFKSEGTVSNFPTMTPPA